MNIENKDRMVCFSFDIDSQKFLKKFKNKYNKIASAMIPNKNFIELVAKERK